MAESKRLSVPTNPARALRELSREQRPPQTEAEETTPSNEVSIIASNEETNTPSNDAAIIPSLTPSSKASSTPPLQQVITPSIDETLTPTLPPSSEGVRTPLSAPPAAEASVWTQSMREALDAQIKAHLMQQMMAQNEKGPVTRLNVEMAEDLHLRLKQNCVIKRRPIKAVINALIAFYLEQEEK